MPSSKERLQHILSHVQASLETRTQLSFQLHFRNQAVDDIDDDEKLMQASSTLFTQEALAFLNDLTLTFQDEVEEMYLVRQQMQSQIEAQSNDALQFLDETRHVRDDVNWTIDPIPEVLQDRRVDVGDISPANTALLIEAMGSQAQGVQVDLDDGHCPNWFTTMLGLYNIYLATRHALNPREHNKRTTDETEPYEPLIIVRPRAWNMMEMNVFVKGRAIPAPLFDFAMHVFHNGNLLHQMHRGPFLYLSKMESYLEARLWAKIFIFAEQRLGLPKGSIKATVLIENISAAFQMHEILYELRHHAIGLNCGMWDYSASIIARFHHSKDFILPDRKKYVTMQSRFLKSYMDLLIRTCHRRRALATTGMSPFVLAESLSTSQVEKICQQVRQGKEVEALAGSDGALVYDLKLIPLVQECFRNMFCLRGFTSPNNQLTYLSEFDDGVEKEEKELFTRQNLLSIPMGNVTLEGLAFNLTVGLHFIYHWFHGEGTFVWQGCVEDSATAEISRSQVWQWLRFGIAIEGTIDFVTPSLVLNLIDQVAETLPTHSTFHLMPTRFAPLPQPLIRSELIQYTKKCLFQVVMHPTFPPFLTTYLQDKWMW